MFETKPVLRCNVAVVTKELAASVVHQWAAKRDRSYAVEAADAHVVTRARHEKGFGESMAKFDLICPDGMPVLWTINRQLEDNQKLTDRVCGADLMEEVFLQSTEAASNKHFLLGGSQQTLDILKERLSKKFPQAEIADIYSPPFGQWPEDEFERISGKITASGAHHVWVGLGCPKQETWIAQHKEDLPPACYYGVGAAFAFHAGQVDRAPAFFRNNGLEWFYRLCKEPKRLWKRYFTYNSLFVWYTIFAKK